jgi:hypothetical protein
MQPRQILIVAAVVIVAFGAAFGIAGAGGGDDGKAQAAPALEAPETIDVERVPVAASVSSAAALPTLKVPEKKAKQPTSAGGSPALTPAPESGQTPTTPNTAPTTPTTPTAPTPQTPNPQPQPEPEEPIKVIGGED